jgi:hypothetical protein
VSSCLVPVLAALSAAPVSHSSPQPRHVAIASQAPVWRERWAKTRACVVRLMLLLHCTVHRRQPDLLTDSSTLVCRRRAACVPPVILHAEPAATGAHSPLGAHPDIPLDSTRAMMCITPHPRLTHTHTHSWSPQHVSLVAGAITGGVGSLFTVQPPRTAVAITLGAAAAAAVMDKLMSSDIVST